VSEQLPRVERHEDGEHPVFFHDCAGTVRHTILPIGQQGWTWQDDDTLTPSVHCHTCGTHGWWRNGEWERA
jgi:hypothetical protein